MPAGRPRKPIAQHERDGTFNVTRHSARKLRTPTFDGQPEKPKGMSKDAQKLWDYLVPRLAEKGVATDIDVPVLEQLCWWWARLKKLQRKRKGTDDYQFDCRLAMTSKQFHALAAKCGVTPIDRARLEVASGNDPSNPLEKLLNDQPTLKVVGSDS